MQSWDQDGVPKVCYSPSQSLETARWEVCKEEAPGLLSSPTPTEHQGVTVAQEPWGCSRSQQLGRSYGGLIMHSFLSGQAQPVLGPQMNVCIYSHTPFQAESAWGAVMCVALAFEWRAIRSLHLSGEGGIIRAPFVEASIILPTFSLSMVLAF